MIPAAPATALLHIRQGSDSLLNRHSDIHKNQQSSLSTLLSFILPHNCAVAAEPLFGEPATEIVTADDVHQTCQNGHFAAPGVQRNADDVRSNRQGFRCKAGQCSSLHQGGTI